MAKKKELTLEEARRYFNLIKSYNNVEWVHIKRLAKELKVNELDLWEFILQNRAYFRLIKVQISRVIVDILENPMPDEELEQELENEIGLTS